MSPESMPTPRSVGAFARMRTNCRTNEDDLFLDHDAQKQTKAQLIEKLRQRALALDARHGGSLKIERWFKKPVNNARLATVSSYYEMLPGFEAILKRCGGDVDAFFAEIDTLKKLGHDDRRRHVMQAVPSRS